MLFYGGLKTGFRSPKQWILEKGIKVEKNTSKVTRELPEYPPVYQGLQLVCWSQRVGSSHLWKPVRGRHHYLPSWLRNDASKQPSNGLYGYVYSVRGELRCKRIQRHHRHLQLIWNQCPLGSSRLWYLDGDWNWDCLEPWNNNQPYLHGRDIHGARF